MGTATIDKSLSLEERIKNAGVRVRPLSNYYTDNADLKFIVEKVIDWDAILEFCHDLDKDIFLDLITTAGKIAGERIAPRLTVNDREGSYLNPETGEVDWAEGVEATEADFLESGNACILLHEHGGLGMPFAVTSVLGEMVSRADIAAGMRSGLTGGVAETLEAFGSEELKAAWLPKFVAGEVRASMDLTEAQAGSGLGDVLTRAEKIPGQPDNVRKITGTKMFITAGDGDLHLALARDEEVFESTKGNTKGISMYLIPKEVDGKSNNITITKTEHKLGINSSATCALAYDGSVGYLVGNVGEGMKHMLRLMYGARLGVAAQGLGLAEAAYREAYDFATNTRKQFGKRIRDFELITERLVNMKASLEAQRALMYECSVAVDIAYGLDRQFRDGLVKEEDKAAKQKLQKAMHGKSRVLTPLIKYMASEECVRIAKEAVQVHGGVGFTKEYLVEHFYRDSIITTIYEGTSEIQLSMALRDSLGAQLLAGVMQEVKDFIKAPPEGVDTDDLELLKKSGAELEGILQALMEQYMATQSIGYALLCAREIGEIIIDVYCSYLLLKQSLLDDRKKKVAKVFLHSAYPRCLAKAAKVKSKSSIILEAASEILDA